MQSLSVKEAKKLMDQEAVTIIDVREEDEFMQAYIKGSQLACLSRLPKDIQNIKLDKDKKIIVYCLKGGRSAQAIEFLDQNILKGYDVYNLEGGIKEWSEHNFPLVYPNNIEE